MKKNLIVLFATASIFASVSAASAAENMYSGQLTVKVDLKDGCTVNFGDGDNSLIDFGVISVLEDPMTKKSSFSVDCNYMRPSEGPPARLVIKLDKGDAAGSTVAKRLLASDKDSTLEFQVYQGSQGNTIWGDDENAATPAYRVGVGRHDFRVTLLRQAMVNKSLGLHKNTMIATVNYDTLPSAAGN